MQHSVEKYLFDIKISIASIEEYLGAKRDFNVYNADKKLRRAVERELEIIGEAVNKIKSIAPNVEISDARKIIDLRNLVIHSYDSVDNAIIWGIIVRHLPKLKQDVVRLLK